MGVFLLAAIGCLAIIIVPVGVTCFRRNAEALSAMAASKAPVAAIAAPVLAEATAGDARIARIISEIPQRRIRRHA